MQKILNWLISELGYPIKSESQKRPKNRGAVDPILDRTLFKLSPTDDWKVRDACEGVQIFGAIGSGKTSGSGARIARAYLENNYGGIIMTAKPDECDLWRGYAKKYGRAKDLIVFEPKSGFSFNFLDYEMSREGDGGGMTDNIVRLFMAVMEVGEKKNRKASEGFWDLTLREMLTNAIDLIRLAGEPLSVIGINDVIHSAPYSFSDIYSEEWKATSKCFQLLELAGNKLSDPSADVEDIQDYNIMQQYWLDGFVKIPDKTRGIICTSFTSMASSFMRGMLRNLFCTTTNITPEMCWEQGKIIILNLPIKIYAEAGQNAQVLFKYLFQKAVERRNISEFPNPCFIWADESQYFIHSYDQQFQATARSSRACTVYLTQNLPNYYNALGGESSRSEVDSLMGNFQTKIFHANGDPKTNLWASDTIARTKQNNISVNGGDSGQGSRSGHNISQTVQYEVMPVEFTSLAKGGPDNDFGVEGIVFQGGRIWKSTGKNFIYSRFNQL